MHKPITVSGPCIVCGDVDYFLSMGGPGICPACDCGHGLKERLPAYREQIKQLQAENKRLKEENRWIPVSERMPKNVADVWIVLKAKATESYVAGIGFYGENEAGHYSWEIYGEGLLTEVTHWQLITLPQQALKEK